MKSLFARAALAAAAVLPLNVHAAETADLAQLRAEVEALKRIYEERLRQLEARLAQAEAAARAAAAPAAPAPQVAVTPAPVPAPATSAGANAFNPAISVVLTGGYTRLSRDPAAFRLSGFLTGGEVGPGKRGFSLVESELTLSANVDPYLSGEVTLSVAPDNEVDVEEAFFRTTALGNGLGVKGGRFFSGVGYLNEFHRHAWDFVDAPLAYQAFLGGQFGQDGLQLRWLAPTDTFVELGAELGSGRNFPGNGARGNGIGAGAITAHAGGDVGLGSSWRAGVSYLSASPRGRSSDGFDANDVAVRNVFSGTSRLWLADFVWKWAPNGNPVQRNLKLQAEVFRRRESGTLIVDADHAAASGPYASRQWGGYAQAVYQFMPRWSTGLRYDRLDRGSVKFDATEAALFAPRHDPSRISGLLSFAPSEFSRFRIQFASDRSRAGVTDNQFRIDYTMSLGAHGAHSF